MNFNQLTTWNGEIKRRDYLFWGVLLFAIKYNLDRLIAGFLNRQWFITDYFIQADKLSVQQLDVADRNFYLILLIQSLPFIWIGTVLCVKRLRNAKLPEWLVIFFFIPFINFLLFLLLSAIPTGSSEVNSKNKFLSRLIPKSKNGSAMFSVAVVSVLGLAMTGLMVNYLQDYGWSLFVGIPFFMGFGSVLFYGYNKPLLLRDAMGVAFLSVLFFSLIIFILAFEGIICIVMAFPIFVIVAGIGAVIGYAVHNSTQVVSMSVFVIPVFAIPAVGLIEHESNSNPPTVSVTTEIIIDAPKQKVWNEVVAFSKIEEPSELIFKTGIAYPTHAEIDRKGVGAIRKCNFTTGCFIEPITIWDEPNLLEFGVLDQPPPMIEWSIYTDLEIAHLDGYFKSVKGQFKLEELPSGQTRLVGTTWYHHDVWPTLYWKLWSDYILHKIHTRVLKHIKQKVETH
jgi:uncharacterized membrane protein YhaH (DUF805 family)